MRTFEQSRLNSDELAKACARKDLEKRKHSMGIPHLEATVWMSKTDQGVLIFNTFGRNASVCK